MLSISKEILSLLKDNESKTDEEKEFLLEKKLIDLESVKHNGLYIRNIDKDTIEIGHPSNKLEVEMDASNMLIIKIKRKDMFNIFNEI